MLKDKPQTVEDIVIHATYIFIQQSENIGLAKQFILVFPQDVAEKTQVNFFTNPILKNSLKSQYKKDK